ncbi:NUDIX domain-containing protein [Fusarium austroafricanum]|uniref:NUDIX domain-containing protein n=1 Tax=Fusarium austroafricanum TaxID=2364996 RepID=A0A8H4JDX3_9HYPO|nr:NUDIX domain-containing protein [Fusarium austroafricanum]
MKVTALGLVALATTVFAGTMDSSLGKRACTPSTCHCNGIQGQFCGYDDPANPGCRTGAANFSVKPEKLLLRGTGSTERDGSDGLVTGTTPPLPLQPGPISSHCFDLIHVAMIEAAIQHSKEAIKAAVCASTNGIISHKTIGSQQPGIQYGERSAVRVVVTDTVNRVAIVKVAKDDYYKLPGGGIEEGEDHAKTAERDVFLLTEA